MTDLDTLAGIAQAADAAAGRWLASPREIYNLADSPPDAAHIAAFDPTTALSLIARIRQLEAALVEACDSWEGWEDTDSGPISPRIAELRKLVHG